MYSMYFEENILLLCEWTVTSPQARRPKCCVPTALSHLGHPLLNLTFILNLFYFLTALRVQIWKILL